jgi:FG-GAP repeat
MKIHSLIVPVGLLGLAISLAKVPSVPAWRKLVLTQDFITEGLSAGDIDGDGVKDLVAGAFWFKGRTSRRANFTARGGPSRSAATWRTRS